MTGRKMIALGFLFDLVGFGLLILMCIPQAPYTLAGLFISYDTNDSNASVDYYLKSIALVIDPRVATFMRVVVVIGVVLLVLGLATALVGLFLRDTAVRREVQTASAPAIEPVPEDAVITPLPRVAEA